MQHLRRLHLMWLFGNFVLLPQRHRRPNRLKYLHRYLLVNRQHFLVME